MGTTRAPKRQLNRYGPPFLRVLGSVPTSNGHHEGTKKQLNKYNNPFLLALGSYIFTPLHFYVLTLLDLFTFAFFTFFRGVKKPEKSAPPAHHFLEGMMRGGSAFPEVFCIFLKKCHFFVHPFFGTPSAQFWKTCLLQPSCVRMES